MEKLKPCPFCGSGNVFKKTSLRNAEIYCGKCGATIERGISCGKCDSLREAEDMFGIKAVEAWNRRYGDGMDKR